MSSHRKESLVNNTQAASNPFDGNGFNSAGSNLLPTIGSPQKTSFPPSAMNLNCDFPLSAIPPNLLAMWPSLALSYKFAMMSPLMSQAAMAAVPNMALNASLANFVNSTSPSMGSSLLHPSVNLLPSPCPPLLETNPLYPGVCSQPSMPYPDLWLDFQRKCYLMLEDLRRKELENAAPLLNPLPHLSGLDDNANRQSPPENKDRKNSVFPTRTMKQMHTPPHSNTSSQFNFFPINESSPSKMSPTSFPVTHSLASSLQERDNNNATFLHHSKSSLTSSDCGSLDTLASPSSLLPTAGKVKNYHHHHHHHSSGNGGILGVATSGASFEQNRFKCTTCKRSYSTSTGLQKHKEQHCQGESGKQYTCHHCTKIYHSMSALKMHIRTHTLPCKCSLCGKAFSRMWLLNGHIRTHTGEKPFSCQVCSRSFADRSNLRAHMQTHSEVKRYRCTKCEKTFSRMGLLTKHKVSGCIRLSGVITSTNIKQEMPPTVAGPFINCE